jgi:beta-glucosidase
MKSVVRRIPLLALACALLAALTAGPALAQVEPPLHGYGARINKLLSQMTEAEKVSLIHSTRDPCRRAPGGCMGKTFYLPGVPRLGIPPLHFIDGPAGVALRVPSTQMPAPVSLAATFDPDAALRYGVTMGREARSAGQDVLQGPMVNLVRVPQGGRNFETLGEDPLLAATLASSEIEGIQSQGVMAMVKHFAENNFELGRRDVSVHVSERALQEGELVPFHAAVKAGVASLMCSNNRVNDVYACANTDLLGMLKHQWHFPGFVRSDGAAAHRLADLVDGLDVNVPQTTFFDQPLLDALNSGTPAAAATPTMPALPAISAAQWRAALDDAVLRVLREMDRFGLLDPRSKPRPLTAWRVPDARRAGALAIEGATLLRNKKQMLPLDAEKLKPHSVLVTGAPALVAQHGTGSSELVPYPGATPPLVALRKLSGHSRGFQYVASTDPAAVAQAARGAKAAIVFAYDREGENHDRGRLILPRHQDELIEAVARANKHTIVVLNTGGPVEMPWLHSVAAVLEMWYPGQRAGQATARVLLGKDSPGGRLPVTFPAHASDAPSWSPDGSRYPGIPDTTHPYPVVHYAESIFFGYRWYQHHHLEPLFPFGFGLSYTHFRYSDLSVRAGSRAVHATFTVTNTGDQPGTAVPQLYLGRPASAPVPMAPRALAGFTRVDLRPGRSATVELTAGPRALSYWSTPLGRWVRAPLKRDVLIGESSEDIRLKQRIG